MLDGSSSMDWIHSYRKYLRAQLIPEWGPVPLNEITTLRYQAWM